MDALLPRAAQDRALLLAVAALPQHRRPGLLERRAGLRVGQGARALAGGCGCWYRGMTEAVRVRVGAAGAGTRLGRSLAARLAELSRARLRQLILDGAVLVAGAAARASLRPRAGAEIEVRVPGP